MVPVSNEVVAGVLFTVLAAVLGMLLMGFGLLAIAFKFWQDRQRAWDVVEETHEAVDRLTHQVANPDQAWYWTPEWQAGEDEADEAITAGRLVGPMDERQFEEWLDRLDAEAEDRSRAVA